MLQRRRNLEGQLRLACADEHEKLEVIVRQLLQRFRLDVLEVNEDVVCAHGALLVTANV